MADQQQPVRGWRPGPGLLGFRISASTAPPDWQTIDAVWGAAGEAEVFDAGWMSDHLSDVSRAQGGGAFETVAMAGALAHRVPGLWMGVAVFAATFRHPALLAKSATVLDNVTGGRFILGLGTGWHEGEHRSFGIPLPPPAERFDRFESYVATVHALLSDEACREPGITRDDPFFPLEQATNEPPPLRPGGPPLWLGGQRRRGIALAVRYAQGWPMPGNMCGDVDYFAERRDVIRRALEDAGRDPAEFIFAGQVACGNSSGERRQALEVSKRMLRAGADHLILAVPAGAGAEGLRAMAEEVARPLREWAA
ncbi:MAG TPA: LLM class flavin-dependent oxidoreductase [Candidatus Limnocylindria bacterium]|nr:LLM class flavin-dependent oxidoreductase [Candidatus Limnocylindria bacterium]